MILDARGKPCPQPVVLTMKALEGPGDGGPLEVLVDNSVAVQNLQRLAAQKGLSFSASGAEGRFSVLLGAGAAAGEGAAPAGAACPAAYRANTVVAVTADVMGGGSDELGKILLRGFLYALSQLDTPPRAVLFYNGGARLTAEGSASLDDLRALEKAGTEILTCGTCIDYYGLSKTPAVGGVTNMYAIVQTLSQADHVIRP